MNISVKGDVAFIIPTAADLPSKDLGRVARIGDSTGGIKAVKCRDIVARHTAPVRDPGFDVEPTLDSSE